MLPVLRKTLFIWCMLIAVHGAWSFTAGRSRLASFNHLGACHAARTVARPASKRTAVGLQKPQTGVLDFLEGTRYDACLLLLHHMHLTIDMAAVSESHRCQGVCVLVSMAAR